MKVVEKSYSGRHFLYDADALGDEISASWFDPSAHRREGTCVGEAMGRGTTYIVMLQKQRCALRHYRRGGWMAALLGDKYRWKGLQQTRAWQEWHLLAKMRDMGLPVPQPLAAHVEHGGHFYRADLLTRKIENSQSLADILRKKSLPKETWGSIGVTIWRFHQSGIYHDDLNAHNIMLDDDGQVFLIDFDKGELREGGDNAWRKQNLDRLKRSLDKLKEIHQEFWVSDDNWWSLMRAYEDEEIND